MDSFRRGKIGSRYTIAFPPRLRALAKFALFFWSIAWPAPVLAIVGPAAVPDPADANVAVMVLTRNGSRAGFCTGTVLSPTVVLTAAHCLASANSMRIYAPGLPEPMSLLGVAAVQPHPLYRPDAARLRVTSIDLGLIRLRAPLPPIYKSVEIAGSHAILIGQKFQILGYGVSIEGSGKSAGVLRRGVLVARAPLSRILLWANDPTKRGVGACEGDSGAPILDAQGSRLVAIADWATGSGDHHCGALTQGALVAPQIPWIAGVLSQWSAP